MCLTFGALKFNTIIDPGNIKLFRLIVNVECKITICLQIENCIYFFFVGGNHNDTLELGF